jgi:hypothetical protein
LRQGIAEKVPNLRLLDFAQAGVTGAKDLLVALSKHKSGVLRCLIAGHARIKKSCDLSFVGMQDCHVAHDLASAIGEDKY